MPERRLAGHERHGTAAQRLKQRVHNAAGAHQRGGIGEELLHDAHQHDCGDEMRRVGHELHGLFEALAAQLVHHQREQYAAGEFGQQAVDAHRQRVADDAQRIGAVQEAGKVLKDVDLAALSRPGTAPDALDRLEILKGDLYAQHRPVAEEQQKGNARQNEQIKLPVGAYFSRKACAERSFGALNTACRHVFS